MRYPTGKRAKSGAFAEPPSPTGAIIAMLGFFVLVLLLLLVGERLSASFLPVVPGPIIGMALLLAILVVRRGVPESFTAPANGLVGMLTLFILPASLGIIAEWGLVGDRWPIYLAVAVGGSILTAVVAALLGALLLGRGRT